MFSDGRTSRAASRLRVPRTDRDGFAVAQNETRGLAEEKRGNRVKNRVVGNFMV